MTADRFAVVSCNCPASWPVVIHRWKNGETQLLQNAVVAFGQLIERDASDEAQAAAKSAATLWVDTNPNERVQRLQMITRWFRLDVPSGLTQAQVAERFLRS